MYYKIYIEKVYELEADSHEEVHDIIMNDDLNESNFVADSVTIREVV